MSKSTIIEAQSSNTHYEGSKQPGILGKIAGVFADYKHGTRNGDRLYTEKLWDERVFGSEDVQEALRTKTLFGELDHPEGDRCETLAKNAAITITKLEKKPDEGVIYGEAEILDTPSGRILKTLADSGAALGISSRGIGEEVYEEGQNIIDPETYDFITFDVVVTPANEKARVTLTEGKELNLLKESFEKEINEAETENQLDQLKSTAKSMKLGDVEKIIENKLKEMNTSKETNKTILEETNKEILKKLYKEHIEKLEREKKALEGKAKYFKNAKDRLSKSIKEEQSNKTNYEESLLKINAINRKKAENLKADYDEKLEKIQESKNISIQKYNKLLKENKQLKEENKVAQDNYKTLYESNKQLKEESKKLENINKENNILNTKFNNLLAENKRLANNLLLQEKILKENKALKESIESNKKKIEESKLQESNKIKTLTEENNNLKSELAKKQESIERMNKLPFMGIGNVNGKLDNVESDYTEEDKELFNALIKR